MRKIRIRIAGVLVVDKQVLLVKHRKANREYYLLPGGGQKPGESQREALAREWQEELSVDIKIGRFLFCGESVPPRGLLKSQVLQMTYEVKGTKGDLKLNPDGPLVGYDWLPTFELQDVSFFPACLGQLNAHLQGQKPMPYERYEWLR